VVIDKVNYFPPYYSGNPSQAKTPSSYPRGNYNAKGDKRQLAATAPVNL
jgi:hypothetical protein